MSNINTFKTKDKNLQRILQQLNDTRTRVRIFTGDSTGLVWNEENDCIGTIGCSTGEKKIPLLIHSARSFGGCAIMDDSIVGIITTKGRWLYKRSDFHFPNSFIKFDFDCGKWVLYFNNEIYSTHDKLQQAENLQKFMRGERFKKN